MNKRAFLFLGILYLLSSLSIAEAAPTQQSSYELMSAENKAMQDDPLLNPAMFWVGDGESLWQQKLGPQNKSCSTCNDNHLYPLLLEDPIKCAMAKPSW